MHRFETYISALITIIVAIVVSGCTSSEEDFNLPADTTPVAVRFDTYASKAASTRAGGDANSLNNITSTEALQQLGFGVFAYYTDDINYPAITKANSSDFIINKEVAPNFMFNQKVEYKDGKWQYQPLKYWPNEYGKDASSTTIDRVSFFAYAPYSDNAPEAIAPSIVNSDKSDPLITYTLPTDVTKSIDILVGTRADGTPNIDLTKQSLQEKVNFLFKHALSRFSIDVRGVFEEVEAGSNEMIDPLENGKGTLITIDGIKISNLTIPGSGTLNLYTKKWTRNEDLSELQFTGAQINENLKDPGETAIKNYATDKTVELPSGVTHTPQNIYAGDHHYTLIPPIGEQKDVQVEITYYVNTYDPSLLLTGGVSRVENRVKNKEILTLKFEEGKIYTLHLLLGMTTVKFSVEVEDWKEPIIFNPMVTDWEEEGRGTTVVIPKE